MRRQVRCGSLFIALIPGFLLAEVAPGSPPPEVVDRYLSALHQQQARADELAMEVQIDAEIPRLKKSGRMQALRFISRLGQITYRILRFEGDNTVRKDVIARYLAAEQKAKAELSSEIAITPDNYKFKYKGTSPYLNKTAHVFQVTPKRKRVGLFRGELWIDSETYLPLREWGEMVKSPSVFLKNVYFVRDYYIQDGMAVPRRVLSDISTRLVGKVQMTIWFDHVVVGERAKTQVTALLGGSADGEGPIYWSR